MRFLVIFFFLHILELGHFSFHCLCFTVINKKSFIHLMVMIISAEKVKFYNALVKILDLL